MYSVCPCGFASGYSNFLQSETCKLRLTGDFKLTVGVNKCVCVVVCLCISALRWTGVLSRSLVGFFFFLFIWKKIVWVNNCQISELVKSKVWVKMKNIVWLQKVHLKVCYENSLKVRGCLDSLPNSSVAFDKYMQRPPDFSTRFLRNCFFFLKNGQLVKFQIRFVCGLTCWVQLLHNVSFSRVTVSTNSHYQAGTPRSRRPRLPSDKNKHVSWTASWSTGLWVFWDVFCLFFLMRKLLIMGLEVRAKLLLITPKYLTCVFFLDKRDVKVKALSGSFQVTFPVDLLSACDINDLP